MSQMYLCLILHNKFFSYFLFIATFCLLHFLVLTNLFNAHISILSYHNFFLFHANFFLYLLNLVNYSCVLCIIFLLVTKHKLFRLL